MSPRIWWAQMRRAALCLAGAHEWVANVSVTPAVPADQEDPPPAVLRQRCLHCGAVTAGWELGDGPRYTVRPGAEANPARLVMHNPRLKRCPCAGCETRRRERRQRTAVTRIRGAA